MTRGPIIVGIKLYNFTFFLLGPIVVGLVHLEKQVSFGGGGGMLLKN